MPEIIKTYRQPVPALRFIGIEYGDADRQNGTFGAKWGEWFAHGTFDKLERAIGKVPGYDDTDAYLGLMWYLEGAPFRYWIGMFTAAGSPVPDGFTCVDFPTGDLAVAWIYGKENELYCHEDIAINALTAAGIPVALEPDGALWCVERYVCPRFTTPDEKGCVILDLCFPAQKA
ncbi:MAG: hypothetical protein VB111_00885 [Clostridiaceae bacterium]|nr:hypothetical protein [Clostridiaceae bacterium]